MKPPSVFRTERLTVRRPLVSDAPALFGYASDAVVTRFLAWPMHTRIDTVEQFVLDADGWWKSGDHYTYVIQMEGRVIGSCGFSPQGGFKADLGYVLSRTAWGQGIAVEASRAMVDWLWQAGFRRVAAFCHADNKASARVMEKLGLEREALLRKWALYPNLSPDPQDTLVYSSVR